MAYNNRGYARQLAGDVRGAFADYAMALHFSPRLALALQNRRWLMSPVVNHRGSVRSGELSGLSTAMMELGRHCPPVRARPAGQTCGRSRVRLLFRVHVGSVSAQATETDKRKRKRRLRTRSTRRRKPRTTLRKLRKMPSMTPAIKASGADAQSNADYSSSDFILTRVRARARAEAPVDDSGGGG